MNKTLAKTIALISIFGVLLMVILTLRNDKKYAPDKLGSKKIEVAAEPNFTAEKNPPGGIATALLGIALSYKYSKPDSTGVAPNEIPDDVTYTIINEETVSNAKRGLDIRLNRKVTENVLRSIAWDLMDDDPETFDRTFIGYYLPGMRVNAGYWATTLFNPSLEVRILGFSDE